MKEKILNVLKIILMIFGALFLIQLFVIIGISIGISNLLNINFDIKPIKHSKNTLNEIKPIINYAEDFKIKEGKYPKTLENADLKLNPKTYFEYKVEDNENCYIIKYQTKKGDSKKQYKRCSINKNGLYSTLENFSEINN